MRIFLQVFRGKCIFSGFFRLFPTDARPSTALTRVNSCPEPGFQSYAGSRSGYWGGEGSGERARFELSQAQVSPPEPERLQPRRPGPAGSHGLEGSVLPCFPLAPSRRERKRPLTRSGPLPSGHLATCLMVCRVGKSQNIGLGRDSEVRWPNPSLLSIR